MTLPRLGLPREHGFWVMAAGALAVGLGGGRARGPAGLAAAALLAVVLIGAGWLGRRIRRREGLQLAAAIGLALLVVPIELAGGAVAARAACDAAALVALFAAGALAVRATFYRARGEGRTAARLGALAALAPVALALGLAATGWPRPAGVAALAAGLALAVAIVRPLPRHLRRLGLALAAAVAAAVVILVG